MKTSNIVLLSGIVALAVAVISCFVFFSSAAPSAGFTQSNVGEFPEGARMGDVSERYFNVSLPSGTAQQAYCNRSGRTQYADALLKTTGTASTTQTLTVGTSTASSFNGFSVPANVKTLINTPIATSSTGGSYNSLGGTGSQSGFGGGVATLADGSCLNIGIYQTYGTGCTGSVCEAATSTNRGFNVSGYVHVLQPL